MSRKRKEDAIKEIDMISISSASSNDSIIESSDSESKATGNKKTINKNKILSSDDECKLKFILFFVNKIILVRIIVN